MNKPHHPLILALIAGSTLALTGCKVGPKYAEPTSETPASFTHTGPETFGGPSAITADKPIDETWWKMLGDPTLDDLVQRASTGSLDLKLAAARIREARAERGLIASEGLPQVDVAGSASRARLSKNSSTGSSLDGRATNLFAVGFDANWELDFFGRVASGVDAADADIQSAEESRRDVLVTLVSEVARNYVELRGFQERLRIAQDNIRIQKETLEIARSRFKAGLTSDLDVAQAESSLSTTQSVVPPLDQAVQASIHRIAVLLGQQPTSLKEELSTVGSIPVTPAEVPVGLPSELLRRRPDIRMAERDLAANTARIGVATADLYPRFSLTGSFGFAADKVPSLPDASSRFWSFGPAVRWPILDWGRIRANIAVQDARTEQSLVRYERAVLESFEDVENALTAFTREQARRTSLSASVASNQRAFSLANDLYKSGISDFQRVLDSQRALFLTQDALSESDKTVTTNLVALYKALGGGWEPFAPVVEAANSGIPGPSSHFGSDSSDSRPATTEDRN